MSVAPATADAWLSRGNRGVEAAAWQPAPGNATEGVAEGPCPGVDGGTSTPTGGPDRGTRTWVRVTTGVWRTGARHPGEGPLGGRGPEGDQDGESEIL